MPNALPRSAWLVNVVVSSDSADGTSSAANAPWQARAVISMAKLTEAPPMAETPANPARPPRNVTLRHIHHFFLCRYCIRAEAWYTDDVITALIVQRIWGNVNAPGGTR